jgi:hypothetical protein
MAQRAAIPPRRGWLTILVIGITLQTARAVEPALLRAVPAGAWVVITADGWGTAEGGADPGSGSQALDAAFFVLEQARRIGLTSNADPEVRAVIDVIGSLPVAMRRSYALCLLGAAARPLSGGGNRLADLRGAVILHTCGDNAAIEARIQHLLNTYVNDQVAQCDTVSRDGLTSHRLIDRRLPQWAQIQWGAVDDYYVLALGSGAFGQIVETIRGEHVDLAGDDWFRSAHERCRGDQASAEWTIRFDSIAERLEPVMAGKPNEVISGLGLGRVQRGLWTVGSRGRAVEAYAVLRTAEGDDFVPICRVPNAASVKALVPPQATRYAVIDYSARQLVLRARDAYLASRSPSAQANLREMWTRIEAETDVSVDRDLLTQLGQRIVIHDYPPHPLGLPLLRTILVEISGSSLAVRSSLDRLLSRYQQHLARPSADWSSLTLVHAPDGVWYLQAGLYGPALAVTDRWIVIGYSPVAVRQNLAFLDPRIETAATQRGPAPADPAAPRDSGRRRP